MGNVGAGLKPAPTLPLSLTSKEGLSFIHVVAEGLFNKETLNNSYSERQTEESEDFSVTPTPTK